MKFGRESFRRVFVGPVEVAGVAQELSKGLQKLGISAQVQLAVPHPFQYGHQPDSAWWVRVWQRLGAARNRLSREQFLRKGMTVVAHNAWGWLAFLMAIFRFDAFIFLYGQTFTNSRIELWLLRCLHRKIIFIYVGSDARPPYMDGGRFAGEVNDPLPAPPKLRGLVANCKRQIRLHEQYANYIVTSPTTAHFFERPYINWFAMGLPKTLLAKPVPPTTSTTLRILHGPSHPLVKGTAHILACIARLRAKGYAIELIKIQGMTHDHVLRELAICDFVVDQLYSDTPMAALATEAAFFAKPAIVGGYFAAELHQALAPEDTPPSLFVPPHELESAIERLICQPEWRHELGLRAYRFVNEHWNARAVAERYLKLLNDDVPTAWWCDPRKVDYLYGCGLPAGRTRRLVASLLQHYGSEALQLADKPELQAAVCAFAKQND